MAEGATTTHRAGSTRRLTFLDPIADESLGRKARDLHASHISNCIRKELRLPAKCSDTDVVDALEKSWSSNQKKLWGFPDTIPDEEFALKMLSFYKDRVDESLVQDSSFRSRIASKVVN